ncbi:FliG C-terminal domain-containing protein [Tundrisphaera sp. TA3]|uniref:FliG C-terminal domain-containing protein n=1 Tax=Tundrisphaera sp. TA3 TaxID=3435775 RepID=UPI003EB88049
MSDLVDFEDLAQLDSHDLRSVFGQVTSDELLDALAGSTPGVRRQLLTKLVPSSAASMEASLLSHGPVSFEAVQAAQRTLVEALCRLSRGGQVAFDDPADMEMVA